MTKVSIIVPVYNAENFLEKSLDSICCQSLNEIEIIVVDDGSTDHSGMIAEAYAQKDSRIKVVYKKNGGIISARKRGLEIATSHYIGFVDADDWIEPNMYEVMYCAMKNCRADLVVTEMFHYISGGERLDSNPIADGIYEYESIAKEIFPRLTGDRYGINGSLCIKLFKKELLQSVLEEVDDSIVICEDWVISYLYIIQCRKIRILNQPFYHYQYNDTSVGHKENNEVLSTTELIIHTLKKYYEAHEYSEILLKSLDRLIYVMLIYCNYKFLATEEFKGFYLFPYELVEKGSCIIIYGAGNVGTAYFKQLEKNKYCRVELWVDSNWEKIDKEQVTTPERIKDVEFDYIVVSTITKEIANQIKDNLISRFGISQEKIVWNYPMESMEMMWENIK